MATVEEEGVDGSFGLLDVVAVVHLEVRFSTGARLKRTEKNKKETKKI